VVGFGFWFLAFQDSFVDISSNLLENQFRFFEEMGEESGVLDFVVLLGLCNGD